MEGRGENYREGAGKKGLLKRGCRRPNWGRVRYEKASKIFVVKKGRSLPGRRDARGYSVPELRPGLSWKGGELHDATVVLHREKKTQLVSN